MNRKLDKFDYDSMHYFVILPYKDKRTLQKYISYLDGLVRSIVGYFYESRRILASP